MQEIADRLLGDRKKRIGEIQAFITDGWIALQDMARHVSGSNAELDHMRMRHARLADLIGDHIEECEAFRRRHEAVGPAADKSSVMKFMLRTNVAAHGSLPPSVIALNMRVAGKGLADEALCGRAFASLCGALVRELQESGHQRQMRLEGPLNAAFSVSAHQPGIQAS